VQYAKLDECKRPKPKPDQVGMVLLDLALSDIGVPVEYPVLISAIAAVIRHQPDLVSPR